MCPCKTYKCGGTFTETCGFSEGFCDMLSKPAEYKVNWVRVYQDKNDPKQKVGCSTKERPTRKFIEAHKKKYMQAGDVSGCSTVAFVHIICTYHVHNLFLFVDMSVTNYIQLFNLDSTTKTNSKRRRYMLTHCISR